MWPRALRQRGGGGGFPAKCVRASALPLDGPARAGVLRAGPSPMGAGAAGVADGASARLRQQHAQPPSVARARPAGAGGRCPAVRLGYTAHRGALGEYGTRQSQSGLLSLFGRQLLRRIINTGGAQSVRRLPAAQVKILWFVGFEPGQDGGRRCTGAFPR